MLVIGLTLQGVTSMERELWPILTRAIQRLPRPVINLRQKHSMRCILRVYFWAVLHDRPISWACRRCNWRRADSAVTLPSQSTMSRRLRQPWVPRVLEHLMDLLEPSVRQALILMLDGKPLVVARHSGDRRATIGRGSGGLARGYKIHAIYAEKSRPVAYRVAPLNVDERVMAKDMLSSLDAGPGYLLADANYDTNPLHEQTAQLQRILVAPPRYPNAKGLGASRRHSQHRINMLDRMRVFNPFIKMMVDMRQRIETHWANLSNWGGGLTHLPPWIRGHRVEPYVTAKIIIRLAKNLATKHTSHA
jgi:hypothetical protein